MGTKIEWATETWNPVVGCTKISPACDNCYALTMGRRLKGMARACRERGEDPGRRAHYEKAVGSFEWASVQLVPEALEDPLHWERPRTVFVVSMGDLFHIDVPPTYVDAVFAVMALAEQHTFIVLTKRAHRMGKYISGISEASKAYREFEPDNPIHGPICAMLRDGAREWGIDAPEIKRRWPLSNVIGMVTAENQDMANKRLTWLTETGFSRIGVSIEPMLGPVDLTQIWAGRENLYTNALTGEFGQAGRMRHVFGVRKLSWVIAGGETGPGARPMRLEWVRSLRDQCIAAEVPFFFKAWGDNPGPDAFETPLANASMQHKRHGRLLDGQVWEQFPSSAKPLLAEQRESGR
jgi:protein gp37